MQPFPYLANPSVCAGKVAGVALFHVITPVVFLGMPCALLQPRQVLL